MTERLGGKTRPVYATPSVLERARQLGLTVLEERIRQAILDGRKTRRRPVGAPPREPGQAYVDLGSGVNVLLVKERSRVTPDRQVWLAVRLFTLRSTREVAAA